jgi:hypothetical protein
MRNKSEERNLHDNVYTITFIQVRSMDYLPHFLRVDYALFNIVKYLGLYNRKFN